MLNRPPLSNEARAAGHRLYQELYGLISEGVAVSVEQAQEVISRLVSPQVTACEIIRGAMAEANYRYREARDEDATLTMETYIPEPSGRMMANADVESLLQEAQIQLWDAELAADPALI
jgi:hypothetical protein